MAAKKTPKKPSKSKATTKPSVNKSQFIRANPTLSTAELVEKGRKQGIELSSAFIYTLRSSDKAKGGKAPTKVKTSSGGDVGNRTATKAPSKALDAFIDLVLERGSRGAAELLGQAVATLKAGAKR